VQLSQARVSHDAESARLRSQLLDTESRFNQQLSSVRLEYELRIRTLTEQHTLSTATAASQQAAAAASFDNERHRLTSELEALQLRWNALQREAAEAAQQHEQALAALREQLALAAQREADLLAKLRSVMDDADAQRSAMRSALDAEMLQKSVAWAAEMSALEARLLADAESKLAKAGAEAAQALAALRDALSISAAELAAALAKCKALEQANADAEEHWRSQLAKQVAEREAEVSAKAAAVAALDAEVQRLVDALADANRRAVAALADKEAEVAALQAAKPDVDVDDLLGRIRRLERELHEAKLAADNLASELNDFKLKARRPWVSALAVPAHSDVRLSAGIPDSGAAPEDSLARPQWFHNGVALAEQDSPYLLVTSLSDANAGKYSCTLRTGGATLQSLPVELSTLKGLPILRSQSHSQPVKFGAPHTLNVVFSGDPEVRRDSACE
jgi:hypothetical protein